MRWNRNECPLWADHGMEDHVETHVTWVPSRKEETGGQLRQPASNLLRNEKEMMANGRYRVRR